MGVSYIPLQPSQASKIDRCTAPYGNSEVTAMVWKDSIGACQFHPEKSSDAGVMLLKHWIVWLRTRSSNEQQPCRSAETGRRKLLSPEDR